mgnify:CR=1 FL=1
MMRSNTSTETEQQLSELKERLYELEMSVKQLQIHNDELQFAYEQESDRRQLQEEERFKADQRSR